MIADGEGADDGVRSLNLFSQEAVKTIPIDTFSITGAAEAAETAALKGIFCNVYQAGFIRKGCAEIFNHAVEPNIVFLKISYDHGCFAAPFIC